MKQITLFVLFFIAYLPSDAQTFSSVIPDSLYAQFFLFDTKKNEIGVFCQNIYDHPELRPNAKYREGDPYSENYERLRKLLSFNDYDFFKIQAESCIVNDFEGIYVGKSDFIFKRKKSNIIFKKLKNRPVHRWYSVPLFNLEKNLALVYWERRLFGCLEVFMLKDGVWKSEFEIICWIE